MMHAEKKNDGHYDLTEWQSPTLEKHHDGSLSKHENASLQARAGVGLESPTTTNPEPPLLASYAIL